MRSSCLRVRCLAASHRAQEESLPTRQRAAPEQPAHTRQRAVREHAALANRSSVLTLEPNLHPDTRSSLEASRPQLRRALSLPGVRGRFGLMSNIERIPPGDVPRKEEAKNE